MSVELGPYLANFTDTFVHAIVTGAESANLAVSTYSIYLVLALLLHGACSTTKTQLQGVMFKLQELNGTVVMNAYQSHFSSLSTSFAVANRLYVRQGYLQDENEYLATAREHLGGDVVQEVVEFTSPVVDTMNAWVSNKTHGKVEDLIPDDAVNSDTRMVVVNAVYFKAAWKAKFDQNKTTSRPFYRTDNSPIDVDMMEIIGYYALRSMQISGRRAIVLEMPFDGRHSMLFMLPESADDFGTIKLNQTLFSSLSLVETPSRKTKAKVRMPKFSIKTEIDLIDVLQSMGVQDVFDSDKADLSGINDKMDLSVSSMKHQAVVEIDEVGAEAAAATFARKSTRSTYNGPYEFFLDRSFFYVIRDNAAQTPLFAGIYVDPEKPVTTVRMRAATNSDIPYIERHRQDRTPVHSFLQLVHDWLLGTDRDTRRLDSNK